MMYARLRAHVGLVARRISSGTGWRIPVLPPYTNGRRITGPHDFILAYVRAIAGGWPGLLLFLLIMLVAWTLGDR
jgi:hypothetical protein